MSYLFNKVLREGRLSNGSSRLPKKGDIAYFFGSFFKGIEEGEDYSGNKVRVLSDLNPEGNYRIKSLDGRPGPHVASKDELYLTLEEIPNSLKKPSRSSQKKIYWSFGGEWDRMIPCFKQRWGAESQLDEIGGGDLLKVVLKDKLNIKKLDLNYDYQSDPEVDPPEHVIAWGEYSGDDEEIKAIQKLKSQGFDGCEGVGSEDMHGGPQMPELFIFSIDKISLSPMKYSG